jgi:hypothetical protein
LLTLGASNAVARDALETPAEREPGRTHHPACFLAASNMRGTLRGQAASHSTPGLSGIIGTYDQDTQIAAIKQCMTVKAPSNGYVCVCAGLKFFHENFLVFRVSRLLLECFCEWSLS